MFQYDALEKLLDCERRRHVGVTWQGECWHDVARNPNNGVQFSYPVLATIDDTYLEESIRKSWIPYYPNEAH